LKEAIRFLGPANASPRITVLGVEPESLAYGMELTPRLQAALPKVVELACETIRSWHHPTTSQPCRISHPALSTI
jgi:Ni,Fe-hydrogenase maturation factor